MQLDTTKRTLLLVLVSTLVAVAAPARSVRAATLVEQGEARATVVLEDRPCLPAEYAAEVLNRYLEASTGVRLPVLSAGEVEALDAGRTWVLIGDSPFARELGLDADAMPFGGYRILARGNVVAVVGRDYVDPLDGGELRKPYREEVVEDHEAPVAWRHQRISPLEAVRHDHISGGSMYGVYRLLEEELGVRWLWPGELGTVIPRHETATVAERDETHAPALIMRTPRNHSPERIWEDRQRRDFGEVVVQPDQRLARFETDEWFRAQHLGHERTFAATHAFGDWGRRFAETRPEFFAYQHLGGTREQRENALHKRHLCMSAPGVVEQFVEDARRAFDRNPYQWTVSASPNDSVRRGHCMCDECRKLDVPSGRPQMLFDGDTREPFEYVQLTDRHLNWWNRLAEALSETHPDRLVAAWAYESYRFPPLRERAHPQVGIGFVGLGHNWANDHLRANDRSIWEGWSERTHFLMLRPNPTDIASLAFPMNYARRIAEDIRWCRERQMRAYEGDTLYGHWSALGLGYYVLARMLWDPSRDVDALVEEYCRAGFGPAAAEIRAYYNLLEEMTDEIAALEAAHSEKGAVWRSRTVEGIGQQPPRMILDGAEREPGVDVEAVGQQADAELEAVPEWVRRRAVPRERIRLIAMVFMDYSERLEAILDAATQAAAEHPDPAYGRRIEFLRQALAYARLEADPLIAWYDAEPEEIREMLDRRDAFLRGLEDRYALDVPRLLERQARYAMNWSIYRRERQYHLE